MEGGKNFLHFDYGSISDGSDVFALNGPHHSTDGGSILEFNFSGFHFAKKVFIFNVSGEFNPITSFVNFRTIKANDSIAKDQRFCKSLDDAGNVSEIKSCNYKDSPVGYIWKDLADAPVVIGITDGGMSDHEPHYHPQPECYYVTNGEGKTLADGKFVSLKKGQYFYIPGNTIHNTPIYEKGLGVIYWYPKNAHFAGFKYRWRRDVKYLLPAEEAFDRVDEIRKRDLNIGPYGTNQAVFNPKK